MLAWVLRLPVEAMTKTFFADGFPADRLILAPTLQGLVSLWIATGNLSFEASVSVNKALPRILVNLNDSMRANFLAVVLAQSLGEPPQALHVRERRDHDLSIVPPLALPS